MWWQIKYLVLASISVAVGQIITIDSQIQKHNEESENNTSYPETVNQIGESKLLMNENLNTQDESAIDSGQSNENESEHSEENANESRQSEDNEIEAGPSEESAIESGQSEDNEIEAGHSEESAIESRQSEENNLESGQSEDNSQNASETESTETEETESTAEIVSEEDHDNANIIEGDIIETDNGPVRGYFYDTSEIQSFLDIPYGKITGAFEAPTQPDSWEEIRNVIQHKTLCPQLIPSGEYTGELDCLTLSVFAHKDTKDGSVLFHIHDGDFVSGSGDPAIYGPNYIVPKGVILILPNYRLGPLGFLCLRNEIAQGNAALKDLTLALNWTKHNIASFGGNPSNIVVSGDGSAGALAGYLALSKKSSGYISKAIVDSGSVLSHWALDREPIENANELAEKIRQSTGTNNDNVFEDIEVGILINAAKDMTFKPCIETENAEEFLTDTPWNILHNERSYISFILGSANNAGGIQALAHTEESIAELNENFQNILPNDLKFDNDAQRNYIAERVKDKYFNGKDIELDEVANLSVCYTDMSYLSPKIRAARPLIKAGATVFFYEFSYVGELNFDTRIIGATKGDTMRYIFSKDTVEVVKDSDDEKIVNLMTDLWTSFIETGEPTANDIEWNKLETTEDSQEEWLSIGPETKLQKGLHLDRLSFWSEIYDEHFVDRSQAAEYKPSIYYTPEPLPRWDGIFEATYRVKCPQPNGDGEENCLVVNVFTPKHGINLPIVVIVHDGGFNRGWGDFEPPHNLINQRFIIITFNYRLGVFGFLCLGVPEAPGNMGLKDQVAAFYWIKRNIINFGGNPNDITVYGIGSGAVSVQMLLASGLPKGLFHKAILESGSMLSPGSFTYEPILDAFNAATVIGYNGTKNVEHLIRFYKKMSTRVLIKIYNKFLVCVESNSLLSALLHKDPIDTLKEEKSYDISLLVTYKTNGIILKTNGDIIKSSLENFENLLPNNLQFPNEVTKLNIANIIKEFYFNRNGDILSVYNSYIRDIFIVYPVIKLATMFASIGSQPVYLMEFSYSNNTNIDSDVDIFNYISTNSPFDENKVAERLVMLYANFINIGDPTPLTTFLLPKIWQPIRNTDSTKRTLSSIPCMHFGSFISMKECSLMQQLALWDKLYKRFYRKIYTTFDSL